MLRMRLTVYKPRKGNLKMGEFRIGDRVRSEYLGDGTVVDETEADFLIIVRFDKTPSIQYNMGGNPTAELVSQLERIS